MAVLASPDYAATTWQNALLSWAILLVAVFANTVIFRKLPLIEGLLTFLHFLGFFAFIIVLWYVISIRCIPRREYREQDSLMCRTLCRVMAPRGSVTSVFTEFKSNGWSSPGLACLAAVNGPVYLTGADSQVHLAEELRDAAYVLPRSMMITAISNYISSFVILGTITCVTTLRASNTGIVSLKSAR